MTVQSLHEDRKFLLKMHGDAVIRSDRVLTRSEYAEHYGSADATKIDWERQLPRALRLILTACHATVVPNQLALSFEEAAYDDKDRLKHAADAEALGAMVRQLIEFSQRMM